MRNASLFRRIAAIGIVALASASSHSLAQEYYSGDAPVVTVSAASLSTMMRRLDALEAAIGKDVAAVKGGWEDTSSEKWSHKWGGRIQGDYVLFADQNGDSLGEAGDVGNYFEFRRIRFFVEGEGYGVYDYKLQVDFEPEGDGSNGIDDPFVSIKDAYFGMHEIPYLGYLRFGHYKAPFSLEELTSSKYITFMERALPNIFSPGREVGITSYQQGADQNWTAAYGFFFDDIPEGYKQTALVPAPGAPGLNAAVGTDDDHGATHALRMTYLPIYDEPSDGRYLVHTGVSFRYTHTRDHDGDGIGDYRFRARPEVHEGPRWIDTGRIQGNSFSVTDFETAVVWGPASLQSELMYVRANDPTGGSHDFYGAYVFGSYFLTGEHRSYSRSGGYFSRVTPYENFWIVPGCVGMGAWEAAIRWSYLDLQGTGDAEAGLQNDLTVGLNWHWNPYIRWSANYIHSWTNYDNNPNSPGTAENDIVAIRGQVDF